MAKKIYYTDPLAAAYMAREFGVEHYYQYSGGDNEKYPLYIHMNGNHIEAGFIEEEYLHSELAQEKFYIHPDSYHIFEPTKGDIVLWANGISTSSGSGSGLDSLRRVLTSPRSKIIQRDNKPFFWPEGA